MTCPETGIRDFPILLGNGIQNLEDLNKSIQEELFIYVSWGPRSNAPKFNRNSPLLDEGTESQSTSSSTLRYNNLDYTLKSVQITQPQHASFVVGSPSTSAKAEAIMIFSNRNPMGDSYVYLCIPILEASYSSGSAYIEAIISNRLNNKQLTLDSLIPTKRDCITYSTCLIKTDRTTNKSVAVNADVFVFVFGLQETANRIGLIQLASGGRELLQKKQCAPIVLPDGIVGNTLSRLFTIQSANEYRTLIRYRQFPKPTTSSSSTSSNRRTDALSAYQCVPLKPDENIKNGKLVIDTDKGVPLSQVMLDKEADLNGEATKQEITPGDIERMIAIVVGVFMGIFVLAVLAYVISLLTSSNAGPAFPTVKDLFKGMLPIVFIAIVAGVVGFLIGFFAVSL